MRALSSRAHAPLIARGDRRSMVAAATTSTSWAFAEGDEIVAGRHAVQLLGGGHRYEAYLAWDDELQTLVTLKALRPHIVADPDAQAMIAREAAALRSLAHPALVRCFDAQLGARVPHLVLEFLDGPRLSTLVRRFGVIVEQLLPLALELCSVLSYLAARGFVHLDVKPKNVIMSAPPRLIDLSVATRVEDVATLTTPTGTDAYMAPEQCLPERFAEIGAATDVWGLGVTLYEAISRSLPFPPGDPEDAAAPVRFPQVRLDPAPLGREVPAPLAASILACLERRPEDRPTALELAREVEPWAARLPQARLGLFRPGGRIRSSFFAG